MKKLFSASLAATALAVSCMFATGAMAQDKVRIATDIPYEPMEFENADGSFGGFDIDLGDEMCARANLECTWQDQEWEGMFPGLAAHKFDVIMSSMTITDKRKKQALFSDPYIIVPSGFFAPIDSDWETFDETTLKGKKIGVQRGTIQDEYVTDTYGKVVDVVRYQAGGDVAVDMEVGRLDLAFFDSITGQSSLIDAYPDKYKQVGPELTKPAKYFGDGFGLAFRKNDTDLAEKFNKALAEVKEDGTYAEIYEKYFHKAPPADD